MTEENNRPKPKMSREEWSRSIRKRRLKAILTLSFILVTALIAIILTVTFVIKLFGKGDIEKPVETTNTVKELPSNTTELTAEEVKAYAEPVISEAPKEEPVQSKGLVIIDAGHGGYDGGAVGEYGKESEVNLAVALITAELLKQNGYDVFLTREDDVFVGLNERADLANSKEDALCFVSIHQNSVENHPEVSGVEAWTYAEREGNKELAEAVCNEVAAKVSKRNRGISYAKNLVVTSKTKMPAAIIECGYISGIEEGSLLMTEDYRKMIAEGITAGIDNFVNSYYNNEEPKGA